MAPAAPELRSLLAFPAIAAVLLLAAALASGWAALAPWGLASCLAAYGAGLLSTGQGLDPLAPLFAAGLLLAAELAYWSLEERVVPEAPDALGRRAGVLFALAAGTAGLGSIVLAAGLLRPAGGPLVLALGVAAAVTVAALLARFAHAPGR